MSMDLIDISSVDSTDIDELPKNHGEYLGMQLG